MGKTRKGRGETQLKKMINGKTVLALIPARAGSKGLANKNIRTIEIKSDHIPLSKQYKEVLLHVAKFLQ